MKKAYDPLSGSPYPAPPAMSKHNKQRVVDNKLACRLSALIATGDQARWERVIVGNCSFQFNHTGDVSEQFPIGNLLFARICEALLDDRFHHMANSNYLLLFIMSEWLRFSLVQRTVLIEPMVETFFKSIDKQTPFLVCELFGEYYSAADVVVPMGLLAQSANPSLRSLLPHALGEAISRAKPEEREILIGYLRHLSRDEVDFVRGEACEMLAFVLDQKKGLPDKIPDKGS